MQFITGGPDVPERLIQAHEEGRVVFFCGAGISYPAGLPGFGGLVDQVYGQTGATPNSLEKAALKARQYDMAIGLLEARLAPNGQGREQVRRAASGILTATKISEKTTSTHKALLTLARCRDGRTRLVTTNFDRLFDEVIARDVLEVGRFHAPLLPVPKNRWDGLVYLHGLLPLSPRPSDFDRLVLSSGDFGLAYLTERWAARFVSELFRNYSVCFVGYSINDPVLRYMMDALAADRLLGESPPEMFAFGSYAKGKESEQEDEWRSKNVTPILYRMRNRHSLLHRTLAAWAATYRDGIGGKEQIVVQHAQLKPQNSTREEDFVGRVLWALSDSSGLPARRFASAVPPPPFDWVEFFAERRFGHDDLSRFGVPPLPESEEKRLQGGSELTFSVLDRPSPYPRAPYMTVARWGTEEVRPDEVMWELAHWLLRYLDEPRLITWLASRGGVLAAPLARLIDDRLKQIGEWESAGNTRELDELRRVSPDAVPRQNLRVLWRLLLAGYTRRSQSVLGLYDWFDHLKRDGLTASLRRSLRDLLAPRLQLRESYKQPEEDQDDGAESLRSLVQWDIALASDHVQSTFRDRAGESWLAALPDLIDDATMLLEEITQLKYELGGASEASDLSYMQQPSISEHPQNRDFYDWTALIDLARDAWIAIADQDPTRARVVAEGWWRVKFPLFKRLSFFAAERGGIVPENLALSWLLADDAWWLWSVETEREALRLLVSLGPRLSDESLNALEAAILTGPPRAKFRDDIEDERWTEIVDREVWLRLAKLSAANVPLSEPAARRLEDLETANPEWELASDERDEFPFWMGDGAELRASEPTPKTRRELAEWLRKNPEEDYWKEDDWAERCRVDFSTTSVALLTLAREDIWPVARWERAIQAWTADDLVLRSWRYFAQLLYRSPDDVFSALAQSLARWLQKVSKLFTVHEDVFFSMIERVLTLDTRSGFSGDEPVTAAINHPIGIAVDALLDWWYRRELSNDQGLPDEIRGMFTSVCDGLRPSLRHGRVLLAAHVINLFLVDREWTTEHLLPHFDWRRSPDDARAVWEGFLWSPRLVRSHLAAIKQALLDTARHYSALGSHGRQYAAFLTYVGLDRGDTFSNEELREAFEALPQEGLAEASTTMARALEGAGEKREFFWTHRILPFWKHIWPKSSAATPAIADDLFRMCAAAGTSFPAALEVLRPWLVPVPHPGYLVGLLEASGACRAYPSEALEWISLLIDSQPWAPRELRTCLNAIVEAKAELRNDARYIRLDLYCRQHGI